MIQEENRKRYREVRRMGKISSILGLTRRLCLGIRKQHRVISATATRKGSSMICMNSPVGIWKCW